MTNYNRANHLISDNTVKHQSEDTQLRDIEMIHDEKPDLTAQVQLEGEQL